MKSMTTAQAVVEGLIAQGLTHAFGLPGLHNDPLFDAFHGAQDRLRVLHARHEQTAGYMALGAALATGKPQAFAVVPGPGFLNTGAALLTAYGMNAPVLALLGQIPSGDIDRGHGHLHEIHDQIGIVRHITKYAARINAPHEAPGLLRAAFSAALSGRQRPVALECGMDIWASRGPAEISGAVVSAARTPIDDDAVEAAAKILGAAKKPLIVVGGGALEASREVTALAEMLEAPVVSYRRGRGIVPTSHRLAVSLPVGHRLWAECDAVLAIGTRLFMQQGGWGTDAAMKIARIDIDPAEPARLRRPEAAIIGDAADAGAALLKRLPKHNAKRASREDELAGHRAWFAGKLSRLSPQVDFLNAIRSALPMDGIFVDEVTQVGFASRLAFPVEKPRTFLSPGYQDNLGWGYGTALGAKAVMGKTPVVSIAGDGGILYQIAELATARQHGLGVVLVVFDNGMFGNVRRIQEEQFGNRIIAADLVNPDFVKLAESFGVAAYRAKSAKELERAVADAISKNAPALVHVPCGVMPSPWDMLQMPRVRG